MGDDRSPPVLDGRTQADIVAQLREMAPYYTDNWDPETDDAGTVMLEVFAELADGVIDRLDRVPKKQQLEFFDSLDFTVHPPQPARIPLTVTVSDSVSSNVVVKSGTTVASPATDDRDEQRFEVIDGGKFEATPATLTDVYGVHPGTDRIVDHSDLVESETPTELFTGEDCQSHALYFGDEELLELNPGSTFQLEVETNAQKNLLYELLSWEYYGENEDGEIGWHELVHPRVPSAGLTRLSEYQQVRNVLDRQESFFERHGYEIDECDENVTHIKSIADDVRKGRFGSLDEEGQSLPTNLLEPDDGEIPEVIVEKLRRQFRVLRRRFRATRTGRILGSLGPNDDPITLSFELPGTIGSRAVDGIDSRWIRARIPAEELSTALFAIEIRSVRLSAGTDMRPDRTGLKPDLAYANDVQLTVDDDELHLLGEDSYPTSTFRMRCEEALSKDEATVRIDFEGRADAAVDEMPDEDEPTDTDEPDSQVSVSEDLPGGDINMTGMADGELPGTARDEKPPTVIWQYWDGDGWRRLDVTDETDSFQRNGSVTFDVPPDIATTEQFGTAGRWIRAQLVSGNYGEPRMVQTAENQMEWYSDHISPPCYRDVTISYSQRSQPFDTVRTYNSRTFDSPNRDDDNEEYRPFVPTPGEKQAVYLGFDAPLRNGPIPIYCSLESTVYPDHFTPWITAEYCSDPERGTWEKLEMIDGTDDLAERGILEITLPAETESFELFGSDRHWIRLTMSEDEFAHCRSSLFVPIQTKDRISTGYSAFARGTTGSDTHTDEYARPPPRVRGIYPNTQWAENARTIEDERLGSSSGQANQTFRLNETPVIDADIWVDERETLTDRERSSLESAPTSAVEPERNADGTIERYWVRWEIVDDIYDADGEARHVVIDRNDGTVSFGDGRRGKIPPAGDRNIKATYRTGGGSDGDVEANTVTKMVDSITFVDSVTNPDPGYGGEDVESIDDLTARAPKQLLDRETPVTVDSFERVASSVSRELATVRCLSGIDEGDEGNRDVITLLIVPDSDQQKPTPTVELTKRVTAEMHKRAPVAVTDGDEIGLVVREPRYVELSVDVTIERVDGDSVAVVKDRVREFLSTFCHPVTGGPAGDGWEIGTIPAPAEFTAELEQLDGVNRVRSMAITVEDDGDELTLTETESPPAVAPDVLVYSGHHDVTVRTEQRGITMERIADDNDDSDSPPGNTSRLGGSP